MCTVALATLHILICAEMPLIDDADEMQGVQVKL